MRLRSAHLGTPSAGSRTRKLLAAAFVTALAVAVPVSGAEAGKGKPETPSAKAGSQDISDKADFYDSRQDPGVSRLLSARAANQSASPKAGVRQLRQKLGNQGIIDMDPLTGTARAVAKLDGFLTPASRRPAPFIALDYVRANPDVFGLDAAAVDRLQLRKDYKDINGTHHLSFIQVVQGIPVAGNGIKANVAKDGRLINVTGSPATALPSSAASPGISASAAREASIKSVEKAPTAATAKTVGDAVRTTTFSDGDRASLVYFITASGPRLAWQTLTTPSSKEMYSSIVDAASGKVLYRQSLVASDSGLAWDNYPGAAQGGVQTLRTFPQSWLPNNSPWLAGNVAHVFSDVNDDNAAQPSEEIRPRGKNSFVYPFTDFTATVGGSCSAQFQCSWDPTKPFSWQTNREQNAVQVLYYIGKFHDHLAAAPIGFTRAAGNFEAVDGDAVQANTDDGANTANGLPDSNHTDNANMSTPPDGIPPLMQMYLFPDPAAGAADPFIASNGGDEAGIIYHEYTHGLSNRLVVDALGNSTLGNIQAGSMGEAWSDWYAMDFLANLGFQQDTNAPGEVRVGNYVGAGQDLIRTQPLDCPVGTTSTLCPGTPGAGPGGYTYGDFGRIIGGPEVHADGEIWGETLWDLRKALGANLAESLVTRAMELSPANPSFLDMRNSILMADQVVNKGKANKKIWATFSARGMGYFAGALDGDDTKPVEDFSAPPPAGTPTGSLSGKVTDQDTGTAIANIIVGFGGHNSGFPGDYAAITDASGNYTITGILPGTYPAVFAKGNGYDRKTATVSIASGVNILNWALRRDWAALSGGGSVTDFNGPDYTPFGCGPTAAIDQSLGIGWGSDADIAGGAFGPKFVTVQLPQAVNIAEIAIDPGNTCGDAGSASTGAFSVETSVDGITFVEASAGTFGLADRHRLNSVALNAGTTANVRYVRFWMRGTQVPGGTASCPGPFSGCTFMDMSELEVYGAPAP
jgi:hypothetical protein